MVEALVLGNYPLSLIERLKVFRPLEAEGVRLRIPAVVLNPVALCEPWHGRVVPAGAPVLGMRIRPGSPHVERDVLVLGLVLDARVVFTIGLQELVVHREGHRVGRPSEFVGVRVVIWSINGVVRQILDAIIAITVAQVQAELCGRERRDDFHLDRVPLCVLPLKHSEESNGGTLLVRCGNLGNEFAVEELLRRGDLSTHVRSCSL